MDDPSEDSRPGQPGVVKKIFITISQVKKICSKCAHHLFKDMAAKQEDGTNVSQVQ